MLHPFMPFITEEIWQALPHSGESIMVSEWPEFKEELVFTLEETNFQIIMDAIRAIRVRRNEMNVPPSRKANLVISTEKRSLFEQAKPFIERLAYANGISFEDKPDTQGAVCVITDSATIYMPMSDLIDLSGELERLEKELQKANVDKEFFEKKLNNPNFVAKAPEKLVAEQKEQLAKVLEKMENLNQSIADIKAQM
jgi:valyl-tRNA synthetase